MNSHYHQFNFFERRQSEYRSLSSNFSQIHNKWVMNIVASLE